MKLYKYIHYQYGKRLNFEGRKFFWITYTKRNLVIVLYNRYFVIDWNKL